ncbi:ribosome-binding protein [Savitreella phatthalungensis]
MDIDAVQGYSNAAPTEARILCCQCGVPIAPNPAAMCVNCIKLNTDITEGIPREGVVNFCRDCERYLMPPTQWVKAELESRELLALCLRKIKGLNKVRLIDAKFKWTEPHSRRIKVILVIQKEAFTSTILQQAFEVEFTVGYQQCPDCAKTFTHHTWKACVQIRQKVQHKRTFIYLEQLILKHSAHRDAMNIQEAKDGLNFYFVNRNQAIKMVDFLQTVVPVQAKSSEELVSGDRKNGTANFKYTYSVELIPICKDDLICLPKQTAKALSNIPQLVLANKVSNSVHFVDPVSLATADLPNAVYWRQPFKSLADVKDMVEFTVLDVEVTGETRGKYVLADVEVVRSTLTGADQTWIVRSHLGGILQPGDTVLGYHLGVTNLNDAIFDSLPQDKVPEVILVKKSYANRRRKQKARNWKLKSLTKAEHADEEDTPTAKKGSKRGANATGGNDKVDQAKFEADYEQFLRDLEEDEELRHTVNLYRDPEAEARRQQQQAEADAMTDAGGDDEEAPEIGIDELLDEFDDMNIDG